MAIDKESQGSQGSYCSTQYDRRPQRYPAFVGAMFSHALLMMLRRKRVILAAGLSLMPVIIPLVLAFFSTTAFAEDGNRVFVRLMEFLYLRALVPLLALFFGCMAIGEDVESQVIPYLLTRPLPRSAIVLGKFGAYWFVSSVIVCISVLLTFAACTALGGLDFTRNTLVMLAHYEGVASLALFGYGALAIFLGAAMKRPIIIGIAIIFGWQRFAYYMPGVIDFLTIEKYVLALLPRLATQRDNIVLKTAFAEFQKQQLFIDAPKALASLLILSGIFLLSTSAIVRWREYSVARTLGG